VTLRLDAAGLAGGDYDASVVVESNDPDEAEVRVPVHLHVTPAADIAVLGEEVSVESRQSYTTTGALTRHHLVTPGPAAGDGSLVLEADGDYADITETATVTVEGLRLGQVGGVGTDCIVARGTFTIAPADLARLTADGAVDAEVQNSINVDAFCPTNEHRLRLRYHGPADALDFGSLFIGLCRSMAVEVHNLGSAVLHVQPLTAVGFTASPAAGFALAPDSAQKVTVTFCPTSPGVVHATLAIRSDDPDEPEVDVALSGEGLIPPDIAIAPDALEEILLNGQKITQRLLIANSGGNPLTFTLEVQTPPAAPSAASLAPARARAAVTAVAAEALSSARDRYRSFAAVASPAPERPAGRAALPAMVNPTEHDNAFTIFFDDMEHGVGGWKHYATDFDPLDLWAQTTQRARQRRDELEGVAAQLPRERRAPDSGHRPDRLREDRSQLPPLVQLR
jgi:hypothetical protein